MNFFLVSKLGFTSWTLHFAQCAIYAGYNVLPGVSVITLESKPDASFLESILSKYYFKAASTGNTFHSVNEGTSFAAAVSFYNFTELMNTTRSCFQ